MSSRSLPAHGDAQIVENNELDGEAPRRGGKGPRGRRDSAGKRGRAKAGGTGVPGESRRLVRGLGGERDPWRAWPHSSTVPRHGHGTLDLAGVHGGVD